MDITEPLPGEDKYSPRYIYRQIFGTRMKGHHQSWPNIDLSELREINEDTVGWIHMDKSPINYPVVDEHRHPGYYLSHNFSGEECLHGSVFMDYRTGGRLGDRSTVLVAHHMKDFSMFRSVVALWSSDYYKDHKSFDLLLDDGMYRAAFFAVNYIGENDTEPIRVSFDSVEDYDGWLKKRCRQNIYPMDVMPTVRDKVIVLFSCAFTGIPNDWRQFLAAYAVIRKMQSYPV